MVFNWLFPQKDSEKTNELSIERKYKIDDDPEESYYIDCKWSGTTWYITLCQHRKGRDRDVDILFDSPVSDIGRDRVIADFKLNKNKYINEYKNKTSQNTRIPI